MIVVTAENSIYLDFMLFLFYFNSLKRAIYNSCFGSDKPL